MKSDEVVVASAQTGVDGVGDDLFFKLTRNTLDLFGPALVRHVCDGERPGFLSALEVALDRKERLGAILVLADRAILAWSVGTLRMRDFHEVIPLATVTDVVTGERPRKGLMKPAPR